MFIKQLITVTIAASAILVSNSLLAQTADNDGRDQGATPNAIGTGELQAPIDNTLITDEQLLEINLDLGISPIDLDNIPGEPVLRDQVILDDLIVDGSACVGFDCVNGESFGFNTLMLKENNLRIKFFDTSNSASFASNHWSLEANATNNGGTNHFAITDDTGGKVPFKVIAGAPTNSFFIRDNGYVGFGTGTPTVQLHSVDGNTPTLRLEQDGSSGFTPQTWDIGSNEANFFIRDATNGSALPFKIRPGAPTSAIDIASSGNVGIGTASPAARLDVKGDVNINRDAAYQAGSSAILRVDTSFSNLFVGDSAGLATIGNNNTFVGAESGFSNTTGSNNVSVGYQAHNTGTTASNVTVVGTNANGSGANSTAIGYQASATGDNSMALGNNAISSTNNEIVLGNSTIVSIGGIVNWTATSDMRFKTDVQDNVTGLEFIDRLKPVTYNMDIVAFERFHGSTITEKIETAAKEKGKIRYSGFLAQEVAKAANDLNYDFSGVDTPKNEGDSYGIRYAEFVVPLVKATQELLEMVRNQQIIIDQQKDEMAEQKTEIGELKAMYQQLDIRVESNAAQTDIAESK